MPVEDEDDLSLAYTPGVAQPCLEIRDDLSRSYDLTRRWNLCAVVTDGTAVLGLGGHRTGIIYDDRPDGMNWIKKEMASVTNPGRQTGTLADALKGADIFIGVSAPGLVTGEMIRSMNSDPIIFACANPTPEIFPDEAKAAGAAVVVTGRSDFPNQVNNVLAFPGVFRGTFDVRASDINEEMKMAAAKALAEFIPEGKLSADYIIPKAFEEGVGKAVAEAVAKAARETGVARI